MARSDRPPDPPLLFDLPLHPPAEPLEGEPAPRRPPAPSRDPLPRRPPAGRPDFDTDAEERPPAGVDRAEPLPAGLGARLRSTAGDLAVHLLAGLGAAGLARLGGVSLEVQALPALALFLLPFSFLYCVIPLFFFGRTLGMRWAGLLARSSDGHSLALGQAVRRWLLGLFFTALAGLPLLIVRSRRSLADRWTGSQTYRLTPRRAASARRWPPS